MTRNQALKEAQRKWGKNAVVRDDGKARASTPELRAAAAAEGKRIRGSIPKDRRPTKEERDAMDRCLFDSIKCRYAVGHIVMGLFFHVSGSGDSWEDAFAQASRHEDVAA